jgi:hypothetical protein
MKPKLTEKDWQIALEKWGPDGDHMKECRFCEIFGVGCCGCPLKSKSINDVCCNGVWDRWMWAPGDDARLAAKVYDFIAKAHKAWKKKQK